ncbi:PKD domain-containing protein [Candidatus Saccharibacteria bacterium]|nr:MAG: PKD domain-containing protein [Candidatus Saccharibacteria bacterium]
MPAHGQLGSPNPNQSGTTGLQGKVASPPPTTAATISTPTSGRNFNEIPITVSGLCKTGLLVKIFSNDIFIGSADCAGGSYSIQVDLFGGQNDLVARVFDALDQTGPDSNKVTVTFQDGQFAAFGQRISLSSNLAKLGAPVGQLLTWPIILSGGTGPYAISIDWGDGTAADLKSQPFAGTFDITHTYKSAGIYRVVVKATDSTGATAFLQIVGVGAGSVTQSTTGSKSGKNDGGATKVVYIWWPLLLMVPILLAMFWVGKRYELSAIHRQLEEQSRLYGNEIQR